MNRLKPITDWNMVPVTFGLEYAELIFNLKRATITRKCRDHELPGRKIGRKWIFNRDEIREMLKSEGQA